MWVYSEEMVRDFYDSYVATLQSQLDRWATLAKHAPLEYVRIHDKRVYISLPAIHRFIYCTDIDARRTPLTTKFGYR